MTVKTKMRTMRERLAGGEIPAGPEPLPPGGTAALDRSELLSRRDELARELAELQWDLGGLTYEMAIRDHFRVDVLMRRAARLQEVDAHLAQAERLVRLGDAGAAGACPDCGGLYGRGSAYCWQCGTQLLPTMARQPTAGT